MKRFLLFPLFLFLAVFSAPRLRAQEEARDVQAGSSSEGELPASAPEGFRFWDSFSLSFRGAVFVIPTDNSLESDPSPVLPMGGAALGYSLGSRWLMDWSVEVSLDIYSTNYGYSNTLNRAVPMAIENRSARIIGFVTGFQAQARYTLTDLVSLRFYAGPALDLRACFLAWDLNDADLPDAKAQTSAVKTYMWEKGRWFFPFLGAGVDFSVNERFILGGDFRVYFPLYKLWTGEKTPIEGWRFSGGIKFTIR
jgi:hypothetical protein